MHFGMGGCQSVDIFLLLPPRAGGFDSLFGPGSSEPPDVSPPDGTTPPSYAAKFHVCPHPLGTLSKFTLGQLSSTCGPNDILRIGEGVKVGKGAGSWLKGTCVSN